MSSSRTRRGRRAILLSLALGMGATALSACSNTWPSPVSSAPHPADQPGKNALGSAAPGIANASTSASAPYSALPKTKGEISFWHFWASPVRHNAIRRVIGAFSAQYPQIAVSDTVVPFGEIWTKAIAAVTAGTGMPDVLVEDRVKLRDRARRNVDVGLGELARRDGIQGHVFWPFTWQESTYQGIPYGLPFETDVRVLYYNRAALSDAELSPDQPPANWDELWISAAPLDRRSVDGSLERVGFFPTFGNMGVEQWAWNNGGEWLDAEGNPSLSSDPNVATFEWMKRWSDRYGKARWEAFQATFGTGSQDGFMSGKVAMKVDIAGYTSFLNFYNPSFSAKGKQRLGWGIAPIPPAAGKKVASLSGGFALSIPRGSKQVDAAWEFVKYATLVGQASWARDTYSMPTVQDMARSDPTLRAEPHWAFFVKAMDYGRPGVFHPDYPELLEVLGPALDAVLTGKQTAKQALDAAQRQALETIDRNRKRSA